MFEQTFVQTQAQTRKPWTVAVSLSVQCLAVGVVLLIPLLHPDSLRIPDPPQPRLIRTWITQPPLPPQHAVARTSAMVAPAAPRPFVYVPPNAHSTAAQQSIEMPTGDPEPSAWAGPVGAPFGPAVTATVALPPVAPAPRPIAPPSPKPPASGPLKVSEGVAAAKLIYGPAPIYPRIAVMAHSQGTVKLEAVIATDGSIRNLRVVTGPPLLVNAAVEAVRQWRYHPTLLNGVAVEVLTEIDVNFALSR
jgi:periplasmic protein TonB